MAQLDLIFFYKNFALNSKPSISSYIFVENRSFDLCHFQLNSGYRRTIQLEITIVD